MEDVWAAVLTYDRSMLWSQSLSGLSGHTLGSLKLLIHASQGRIRQWYVQLTIISTGRSLTRSQGLLITFTQFVIVALFTLPGHFSIRHPPFFLKPRKIPLIRWLPNIVMFFAVNLLNNFAFGYNISVPVHIILRSGGSVMTMLVGYLWGKRYTKVQGELSPHQQSTTQLIFLITMQSSASQCSQQALSWPQWPTPNQRYTFLSS